jgi:germination protein M
MTLLSAGILSACGVNYDQVGQELNATKKEETKKEEVKKEESKEGKKEAATNGREIYLIDKNGYVVPQTLSLPQDVSAAKQVLGYLVEGGPVDELLPNGFRAVLPADTQINSVNIEKEVATVDFSPEFQKYKAEDEQKILQALTWTLTQFENVKKVKIQVNGVAQTEMPVAKTPIGDGLTRASGINFDHASATDIMNTKPVVVYFLSQNENGAYYVPVTRRASTSETDNVKSVVQELVKGADPTSPLTSDFQEDVKLLETKMEDGTVTLNFNENIASKGKISQHTLGALVLSLTEQKDVKDVVVQVNGKTELLDDKGEKLTKPVTRPQNVNTGSY